MAGHTQTHTHTRVCTFASQISFNSRAEGRNLPSRWKKTHGRKASEATELIVGHQAACTWIRGKEPLRQQINRKQTLILGRAEGFEFLNEPVDDEALLAWRGACSAGFRCSGVAKMRSHKRCVRCPKGT